jgi:hypothetical protein
MWKYLASILVLSSILSLVVGDGAVCMRFFQMSLIPNKTYQDQEEVILWVNKVGPYANPQEAYMYYSLPYCRPEHDIQTSREGLGEALQGYELRKSSMPMHFKSKLTLFPRY